MTVGHLWKEVKTIGVARDEDWFGHSEILQNNGLFWAATYLAHQYGRILKLDDFKAQIGNPKYQIETVLSGAISDLGFEI
jgi:hypothetical protein